MRVAFFFENGKRDEGRDLRTIDKKSPGIAGTASMIYLMSHLIAVRDNGIDVTLFLKYRMTMADAIHVEIVTSFAEALAYCTAHDIDYIVVKHSEQYWEAMSCSRPKIIVWCHNFVPFRRLRSYAKCQAVARLICVGREQADAYRDHRAYLKTDWIYNCVTIPPEASVAPVAPRLPIVTYMGAIIPGKGFHLLARAWPKVLAAIPDAELYVIGNGRLYGDNVTLGQWNLAEKTYEDSFMHFLTRDGSLLPGVHLMGVLQDEKFDILRKTKVGVPNPSGLTETFCLSAVEMQLMGASIASRRCIGYMDTVRNGTLVDSPSQLAESIIKELRSDEDHYEETRQYIVDHFSQDVVAAQWEQLFLEAIPKGGKLHPDLPLVHPDFEMKKWKERLRRIKMRFPFLYTVLPSLSLLVETWKAAHWAVWKRIALR